MTIRGGLHILGVACFVVCTATAGVELDGEEEFVKPKLLEEFRIPTDGNPIVLPVKLAGKTYQFLLDTGSSSTTLDISLQNLLGEPKEKRDAGVDENGKIREFNIYYAPDAKLGKLSFLYGGTVLCVDLTPLRESTGLDIRGVIGVGFLRRYMWQLDLNKGVLRVYKSGSGNQVDFGVPVRMDMTQYGCPFVVGKILDKYPCNFMIDTGYPDSGTLSGDVFAKLTELGKIKPVIHQATGSDAKLYTTTAGRMGKFELGKIEYKNLIFERSFRGNILGLGFLSRTIVTLDFPNLKMYLKKTKQLDAPDQNDMSGLHLLRKPIGVVVHSVDADSPALTAGLKSGDVIQKIGGKSADKSSLTDLRNLLRTKDGATVEVQFKRDEKAQSVALILEQRI